MESPMLAQQHELVLQTYFDREVFSGKAEETAFLPVEDGPYAGVLLLGAGKRGDLTPERVRRAAGKACGVLRAQRFTDIVLDVSEAPEYFAEAFLEGVSLGQYDFDVYKKKEERPPVKVQLFHIIAALGADSDWAAPWMSSGRSQFQRSIRKATAPKSLGRWSPL